MLIKSLNIEYYGQKIITDIDNCVIMTSEAIAKHGLNEHKFWYDPETYEKNKFWVFKDARLTDWGKELLELIVSGVVTNYEFLTAARNRLVIISEKLGVDKSRIKQAYSDENKIKYLNQICVECIYVDDISKVINGLTNSNVYPVIYRQS